MEGRPSEGAIGVEGVSGDETTTGEGTTVIGMECGMGAGGCRSGGLWERFNGGVGDDSGGVADLWMVRMWHSSSEEGIWGPSSKLEISTAAATAALRCFLFFFFCFLPWLFWGRLLSLLDTFIDIIGTAVTSRTFASVGSEHAH